MFEGILYFILAIFLGICGLPFLMRGAPFFPTHRTRIKDMMTIVDITMQDRVADIGAGDGRLVIEAARCGAQATGYEVNLFLVWIARWNIARAGLRDLAHIEWRNIWNVHFSSYTVVVLFGFPYMMKRLEEKLRYELPKGARVVSFVFQFPTWIPKKSERGVYLYIND